MLGQCSHQFVWPRRSADGRYYQVCRICEAEYEYDWDSMQRVQGGETVSADAVSTELEPQDAELEAASAPEVVAFGASVQPQRAPRLRLLLERESAYRIFLRNLSDLIFNRTPPPIAVTSAPATSWNDVFVPSSVPWRRFVESLLGHMIVVTALLILIPKWPSDPIQRPRVFDKYVSYYTPPKSFPALRSHPARVRPRQNRQPAPSQRPAIHVASEPAGAGQRQAKPAMTLPPDLIPSNPGGLRLPASHSPAPMMPLAATGNSHLSVPAAPAWVVAPPADSSLPAARGSGLLQASAVAPAPAMEGVASRRGAAAATPQATVIAPAPSVSGSMRRAGDINIGEAAVVKPAPQLPVSEQSTISSLISGVLGGLGSAVVPPPPSVQSAGSLPGGRASLLAGSGQQVVPPTPSVQGASNLAGSARGTGLSPAGSQVVPPAPSMSAAGNAAGNGRAGSFSPGLQAIPPPPSMQGAGGGSGRGGSLSAGLQAVPPAPSVEGGMQGVGGGEGGGSGSGRMSSLADGAGLQGMPPSAQGTGSGTGDSAGAGGSAGEGGQGDPASASADSHEPSTIEIPLRLIGPVLALPGSSYFSNYEVFIAERKLAKGQVQLIKLVYVSLPYQRRLSEYDPSNWTVPKLRVTRDRSCDESLMQMTWPETDPRPAPQPSADSPGLSSEDRTGKLPCYRTTADDYRQAISRSH